MHGWQISLNCQQHKYLDHIHQRNMPPLVKKVNLLVLGDSFNSIPKNSVIHSVVDVLHPT